MAKIADVQEVSLEKLRPYERNAKKHGPGQVEKLKASIMEVGFLTPCLIDNDYNLIAGHGRVMAAKELGIKGENILVVGDGRSEIFAGVGLGAVTVSVLPENAKRLRELHCELGTNMIISDYTGKDLCEIIC